MAQVTADFEKGTLSSSIATTDAGSATQWDSTLFAGTLIYDNTHVAHGSLAMKSNTKLVGWVAAFGSQADHFGRFYMWAAGNANIVRVFSTASINGTLSGTFQTSGGKLIITDASGGTKATSTNSVTGALVRVDYHWIHSATVGQVIAQIFLTPDSVTPDETLTTTANLNTGAAGLAIGYGTVTAVDIWMDDIVAGAASFPGPAVTASTSNLALAGSGEGFLKMKGLI